MERGRKKDSVEALKEQVDSQQSVSFEHQSEVIQYVHDVKEALNQLVDQVVVDQEETTKLCAQTRDAIGHQGETLEQAERATQALREEVSLLEAERDELAYKVDQSDEKLAQARGRLRNESRKLEDAEVDQQEHAKLKTRLNEEATSGEAARRHIAKLEQTILLHTNTEGDLKEVRADLEKAEDSVEQLEQSVAEQSTTIEGLNTERTTLKEERDTAQKAAQTHEANAESLMQNVTELQTACDTAQERADALRESLDQAEQQTSTVEQSAEELADQLEEQTKWADQLTRSLEELKTNHADSDAVIKGHADHIALLENTCQTNETTLAALKEELQQAHVGTEQADRQMDELRVRTKKAVDLDQEKSARLEELQSEIRGQAGLESDYRQLSEQYTVLEAQVKKLNAENQEMKEELEKEQSKGTKSVLAKQLSDALHDQETSQEAIRKHRREVADLQNELAALKSLKAAQPRVDIQFNAVEARQQLGKLLVESGVITQAQLDDVIREREQNEYNGKIGQLFVDKGYATEDVIAQALAHQMDIPFLRIEHNTIHRDAVRLISERIADKHTCVPVSFENGELTLAMENPMDLIAIENVERLCEYQIRPMISTATDIRKAIRQYYQGRPNPR